MKKKFISLGLSLALFLTPLSIFGAEYSLDTGRWKEENKVKLEELIKENANKNNYVVFDWDYTSIYQDTQESLFRYQIDKLAFKMTPEEFNTAIRKDIPNDYFSDDFKNVEGKKINIDMIAQDLVKTYTYLYENYISTQKMKLEDIHKTEEFKDFRGKLAFLYEAIGDSFSHDIAYPWVLYLFTGMTKEEVQTLTKEANDFSIGNKLGKYTLESSDTLKGLAGKVSYEYKSGLRTQPETANLFHTLEDNKIDVYVVSASLQDVVEVFATDKSYGYNLKKENIIGMRLEMKDGKYTSEYKKDYPQTQTKGKVEVINKLIYPKYNKGPILVAGDSSGDENMLTHFKDTKILLLMKREGKLDNLVSDSRALIQKRNPITGLLDIE